MGLFGEGAAAVDGALLQQPDGGHVGHGGWLGFSIRASRRVMIITVAQYTIAS
jgi:hypothetical protein